MRAFKRTFNLPRLKSQIWLIYLFGSVPLNSSKKSRTISRVMSWMIICLILLLPAASSDPPENNPGQIIVLHSVLLRVRFTWHSLLPENRWALTPPFHPYPPEFRKSPAGGRFLLRCHNLTAVRSLACVALCVARTFLSRLAAGSDRADLRDKGRELKIKN